MRPKKEKKGKQIMATHKWELKMECLATDSRMCELLILIARPYYWLRVAELS